MKNNVIKRIFYKDDPRFKYALLIVFETSDGFYELTDDKSFQKLVYFNSKEKGYDEMSILKILKLSSENLLPHVIETKINYEGTLRILLSDNNFIMIHWDETIPHLTVGGSTQAIDFVFSDTVDDSFLDDYNNYSDFINS